MTFMFTAPNTPITPRDRSAKDPKVATEDQWRRFDFGMDCLIPAEDYALPKGYEQSRQD